jgi:hypothetical protein
MTNSAFMPSREARRNANQYTGHKHMSSNNISQGLDRDLAEYIQTIDTRFLLAIHHGDVDVAAIARREMMNRGIDGSGRWVGYAKAGQALGV